MSRVCATQRTIVENTRRKQSREKKITNRKLSAIWIHIVPSSATTVRHYRIVKMEKRRRRRSRRAMRKILIAVRIMQFWQYVMKFPHLSATFIASLFAFLSSIAQLPPALRGTYRCVDNSTTTTEAKQNRNHSQYKSKQPANLNNKNWTIYLVKCTIRKVIMLLQ